MVYFKASCASMTDDSVGYNQHQCGCNGQYSPWNSFIRPPTFDGNAYPNPAPEFVEDLENYLAMHERNHWISEKEKCFVFLASLTNDAAVWARIFGRRYESYESMKSSFLRRFWGADVQWRVRDQFYYGSYRQKGRFSKMGKYFAGMYRRVSFLSPPPSQQHFIHTISVHFPFHLEQQIKRMSSAEDVYVMLIQRDRSLNNSTRLYHLRKQRMSEVNKANPTSLEHRYYQRNEIRDCRNEREAEQNTDCDSTVSDSTASADDQPRRLGGGDVTAASSFNPVLRPASRKAFTLSHDEMRLTETDSDLEDPDGKSGNAEQSVMQDNDIG